MRIVRHTLNNRIRGAVLTVLAVLLIGLIPLQTVFAASAEVSIPYHQQWTNNSGQKADDNFDYRLTALDGAPLPDEANGGYYQFTLSGEETGALQLHFPFSKPGYYNYSVGSYVTHRDRDYVYDDTVYKVMIMVTNTESGPGVTAMTIQDSELAKYAELPFSVAYTKKPVDPGKDDPERDDPAVPDRNGNANRPGAAPAGTAAGTPGEATIPDTATPATIDDTQSPQGILPEPEDWALLNLILMIFTVLMAVTDGILYFRNPTDKYGEEYGSKDDDEIRRNGLPRILALIAAAISVTVFFLTEDMTDPMIWVDEYTIWMLILFIITTLLVMMSKKKIGGREGETEEAAA